VSRAFVSENDSQFEEEEVPAIKIPLPPGARNYMTPEGARALRLELEQLVQNEKPRLSAQISRGVSSGVSSTARRGVSAETSLGKPADRDTLSRLRRRLREVERRIEYLTVMTSRLEVVESTGQDLRRVAFGATVTVREVGAGLKTGSGTERPAETYRIVGVEESDPAKGAISWISPLARTLIAAHLGDTVTLRLPEGERRLEIVAIEYP
jgi:transcription elongation factor GreB